MLTTTTFKAYWHFNLRSLSPHLPERNPPPASFHLRLDSLSSSLRCSHGKGATIASSRTGFSKNGGDILKLQGEEEEPEVDCEVEVISWRERRIRAQISVNADLDSVWNALTDYERLADFIPNLVSSGRIPCPHPGRIWLEQRGLQRALYWQIEARVVLDLQEFAYSVGHCRLLFDWSGSPRLPHYLV